MNYEYILNKIPQYKNIYFENTMLIAYVHILENNKDFFDFLIKMGFKKDKILIFGKSYSTNKMVLEHISNNGIQAFNVGFPSKAGHFYNAAKTEIKEYLKNINVPKNIIVMESGGLLREIVWELFGLKSTITGLELTTQGTYHDIKFPTINVAQSELKVTVEPEIIAECAYHMMERRNLIHKDKIYGIIGNGIIGKALNKYLISNGLSTRIYDKKDDGKTTLDKLKKDSDFIIGATGRNCLDSYDEIKHGCNLISISSGDIEFNDILQNSNISCDRNTVFSDFNIENLSIINGGYPITFDGNNGSENKNIKMTYALWLVGIIQAGLNENKNVQWINLHKDYQDIINNLFNLNCST